MDEAKGAGMKAWRVHEWGAPEDVLVYEECERPVPEPGQVLARVTAAAVGFPVDLMCRGLYQIRPPFPFSPGFELCGEIAQIGEGVEGWSEGDRVCGLAFFPHGAYADYAVLEAKHAHRPPASLDDVEAAALTTAYQTSWFGLHARAAIRPGEILLVHAAAGGVGSAAVQLGKAAGAFVIGVAGGAEKTEIVRQLGADVVVDRRTEDFVEVVKRVTDGHGADVVYDPVGGESYERSTKCIAFEGRIVVVGFAGGVIQAPPLSHALVKNYSIMGLHFALYPAERLAECHAELVRLSDERKIKPLISERLPWSTIPGEIAKVVGGSTVGRPVFVRDGA